jgi:hypothetical protein
MKAGYIALAPPDKLIDDLVSTGFERPKAVKSANLERRFHPPYRKRNEEVKLIANTIPSTKPIFN